ncbi:predicted protein [Verticillium alfalfae VaMs.102]|uniref:Predicted protein n=1 Tax=Verticillium alfalfae (strain VaMs.102 / ATCC MYA-4576 / FGSC 10136) TaxID=526221 RepID=C9SYH4_VERA1|nr:predicted protein [Verticillium alfalfae VaMs.102]EEY23839.1 predicted protein [Verticillium alfalfae VaMs.102]
MSDSWSDTSGDDSELSESTGLLYPPETTMVNNDASIDSVSRGTVTSSTTALGISQIKPVPSHARGQALDISATDSQPISDRSETKQKPVTSLNDIGHPSAQTLAPPVRPGDQARSEWVPPASGQEPPVPHFRSTEGGTMPGIIAPNPSCRYSQSYESDRESSRPHAQSLLGDPQQETYYQPPSDITSSRSDWHSVPTDTTAACAMRTADPADSRSLQRSDTATKSDKMVQVSALSLDMADIDLRVDDVEHREGQVGDWARTTPGLIISETENIDSQRDKDLKLLASLLTAGNPKAVITDTSKLDKHSMENRQMLRWIKLEFAIHQKQRLGDITKAKKLRNDTPATTTYRFATHKSLDGVIKGARAAYKSLADKFQPEEVPDMIKASMDAMQKLDDLLTNDDNEILDELTAEAQKQVNANHIYQQCIATGKEGAEPQIQRIAVIQKSICTFWLRVVMVDVMFSKQHEDSEKGLHPSTMTVQKFLSSDPIIGSAVKLIGDLVEDFALHMKILREKAAILNFISTRHKQCSLRHPLVLKLREALVHGWYLPGEPHQDGQLDAETFRMILETAMSIDLETSTWNLWDETA